MPADALYHLLLALAAVIIAGRVLGFVFRWIGQPPVIGEVVAGILLGPSLLGWLWPAAQGYILPPSVAPHLGMIAQVGVVLYMFCVGLELDQSHLRNRGAATVAISAASILLPFLAGMAITPLLHAALAPAGVRVSVFALFMGAAMSVTAFPVLARILSDRQLTKTPLGALSLTCAAVNDVAAWCLLAFAIGVAQSQIGDSIRVVSLAIGYIVFVLLVVRPAWHWLMKQPVMTTPGPARLAIVLVAVLLSALATELIGVHAIFGAFLLGAIIPHDSPIAKELANKLEDVVVVLLLPAFFAFTGMRTQIGLVSGLENWLWCGLIIAVATAGKFGGTLVAARLTGMNWRESSSLGILMNTRGLMELIVLNIGLDLGVISPTLFAMMVIMALVTTLATSPLLRFTAGDLLADQGPTAVPLATEPKTAAAPATPAAR
jgi:Kef-type K+ transport system membrane component KefB